MKHPDAHFDLRRDKWISVIREDGTPAQLGLQGALTQAHKLRAVSDPLPTVEFGLHRLLVAFVLDIFAPCDSYEWNDLWAAGAFDAAKIEAYFARHEGAFDLFGARPFLQNVGMDAERDKPLAGMLHSMPSGINAIHFHHGDENDFGVAPPVAARLLCIIAPWMTEGGTGKSPSINGAPPLYVLPLGENLWETLLLNTPVYPDLLLAQGDAGPTWRQTEAVSAERATHSSLLQGLTWRPRKIQLVPDMGGGGVCSWSGDECDVLVRAMKFSPGWGAGFDWIDPNAAYHLGNKRTVMRLHEGREVWRDTGPLALLRGRGDQKFQRPALLTQIGELGKSQLFDTRKPLDMTVYGMRTDKMKVFEWQAERLSVPLPLLWEELGQTRAQEAMDLAEKVAFAIKRAVKAAYPREAQGNERGFDALANGATARFWRELRPHYDDYLRFLAGAPDETAGNEEFKRWGRTLRAEAYKALKAAIDDLDGDAKALKRQTGAYAGFSSALFRLLEPVKAEEAKAKRAKTKASTA